MSRIRRTGELAAVEPALRRLRDPQKTDLGWPGDDAEQKRGEHRPQRENPGRDARLHHERRDLPAILGEQTTRCAREAPVRSAAGQRNRGRRDDLRDDHPEDRLEHAVVGTDRDADEPQGHREGEERAAQVVAAAQQQRGRSDVLLRLYQREERDREHRPRQPLGTEDPVGDRREGRQSDECEQSADRLEPDGDDEQPAQPPPVLGCDVAKPELRQRLLDGQIEE